jgi:hypothetical protein
VEHHEDRPQEPQAEERATPLRRFTPDKGEHTLEYALCRLHPDPVDAGRKVLGHGQYEDHND